MVIVANIRITLTIALICFTLARLQSATTINLPTTITDNVSGFGIDVIVANGRSIWTRDSTQMDFVPINLPGSFTTEFLDVFVDDLEVSSDGKYIFFTCNGAEGLYRYNIAAEVWDVCRPLEASRSVSCITKSDNGNLYIGTGGYFRNVSDQTPGIFKSSDNGQTWTEVIVDLPNGQLPGIVSIAVNADTGISFLGRQLKGTAPSGFYGLTKQSGWKHYIYSYNPTINILHDQNNFYILSDDRLDYFSLGATNITISRVDGANSILSIQPWASDTILIVQGFDSSASVVLSKVTGGQIVGSPIVIPNINEQKEAYVFRMATTNDKIFLSGHGNWVYDVGTKTLDPIVIAPARPYITRTLACDGFTYCDVQQHGWYKVSDDTNIERCSNEIDSLLNLCRHPSSSQLAKEIIAEGNGYIYSVRNNGVEAIGNASELGNVVGVSIVNDSSIVVGIANAVFVKSRSSTNWSQLSSQGMPSFEYQDSTYRLPISNIFSVDDTVYAWFAGGDYPVDYFGIGGWYRFNNDQWHHIKGVDEFTITNGLISSRANGNSALCYSSSYTSSGVNELAVSRLSRDHSRIDYLTDINYLLSTTLGVFASQNALGWVSKYGRVYTWMLGSPIEVANLNTQTYGVNAMETGLLCSTTDRGLVLVKFSEFDPQSVIDKSVSLNRNHKLSNIDILRNGAGTYLITLQDCNVEHHNFVAGDIEGRNMNPIVSCLNTGQFELRFRDGSFTGVCYVCVIGSEQSCVHTFIVLD